MVWVFLTGIGLLVGLCAFVRAFWWISSGRYKIMHSWKGKIIVITGANSGIGLEATRELLRHGARVYMLCRSVKRAKEAEQELSLDSNGETFVIECDLSSLSSVRQAAEEVLQKCPRIDVLINNAGIGSTRGKKPERTEDELELTMASNYFGHFLLTHLLLKRLEGSTPARIINVSSLMHRFVDSKFTAQDLNFEGGPYGAVHSYNNSKLAQILFTRYAAKALRGTGVTLNALHPGAVKTNIFYRRNPNVRKIALFFLTFLKNAFEGAQTTLFLADSDEVRFVSGQYFSDCAPKAPSLLALNDKLGKEVFERSCKLVGICDFF